MEFRILTKSHFFPQYHPVLALVVCHCAMAEFVQVSLDHSISLISSTSIVADVTMCLFGQELYGHCADFAWFKLNNGKECYKKEQGGKKRTMQC